MADTRGRSLAGVAGSIPAGGMAVSCGCCLLSGRDLCEGPSARPGEFFRVCVCVLEYDQVKKMTPLAYSEEVDRGRTKKI
jgi:hypothetical protein